MSKWVDAEHLCSQLIKQLQLPAGFKETVENIYFPLAGIIVNKKTSAPLLVNINGVQGSGKSTLTQFLKCILESQFNQHVIEFSLDDFYLTRVQRQQLSKDVHPLLKTRGVPGTHDIVWLETILDDVLHNRPSVIPRFNKSADERFAKEHWTSVTPGVDIILFEGWCNHSPIQNETDLIKPINELEENEDSDGVWRHYANDCLHDYHQRIFKHTDITVMLKPKSFERVYAWRQLQERKLASGEMMMDDIALSRFIQHFERISRHTLLHLPKQVDVVLAVDDNHFISALIQNNHE